MKHKAKLPALRLEPEPEVVKLPVFTFETSLGKRSLEEVPTDMVLLPMLYGMSVPQSLKASDPDIAELIKEEINRRSFEGRRGTSLPVETNLTDAAGTGNRIVLLAGLGRPQCFDADVAETVFARLLDEAIDRGLTKITVPFIANRMTKQCLNLKGTAFRLKKAVVDRFSKLKRPVALKEIQIYCSPQAKAHIERGLNASAEEAAVHDCCG